MNKIKILPDNLKAKLAAGEVITAPVDVVKELVENSLDANSSEIVIDIEKAGKKKIQIIDDGDGIAFDDLKLAVLRYATSKVENDIFDIKSYGFRGEALASISEIAKLEIVSKEKNFDIAGLIVVEGGKVKEYKKTNYPVGTKITVSSLFFNIPARLKFLKSNAVEFEKIYKVIEKLAIANSEIGFKLIHNNRKLFTLFKEEDVATRIKRLWGNIVVVEEFNREFDNLKLRLFVVKNKKLYSFLTFVNKRPVEVIDIKKALYSASKISNVVFKDFSYVLFVDVLPSSVDVNLHPRKEEVKINYENFFFVLQNFFVEVFKEINMSKLTIPVNLEESKKITSNIKESSGFKFSFNENKSLSKDDDKNEYKCIYKDEVIYLTSLYETYHLLKEGENIIILDHHAAEERIYYERLKKSLSNESYNLLNPIVISMPEKRKDIIENLSKIGFKIEELMNSLLIRAVPVFISKLSETQLVKFLQEMIEEANLDVDYILKQMACKFSHKARDKMFPSEVISIYEELKKCEIMDRCPHGRPTFILLDKNFFDKVFKRDYPEIGKFWEV